MNGKKLRVAKSVLVAAALATVVWVSAGDLNPPAGPVAATGRFGPRTEISAAKTPGDADSLFKITQPGSYYLTGNITGVAGKMGIEIFAAGGITLDLMGFDLLGAPGSLDGVRVSFIATTDIAVVNGSVRGWGMDGVDMNQTINVRLADLRVSSNAFNGIQALGDNTVVTGCVATLNIGGGIVIGTNSSVTDCSASGNLGDGIRVGDSCNVRGNACGDNNSGAGIHATGTDNRIEGNNCTFNTQGIDVDSFGNFISRNTCSGNGTNWDVAAGNVILVVNATTAGAVSGDSGGTAPGSTDPNANFTY